MYMFITDLVLRTVIFFYFKHIFLKNDITKNYSVNVTLCLTFIRIFFTSYMVQTRKVAIILTYANKNATKINVKQVFDYCIGIINIASYYLLRFLFNN